MRKRRFFLWISCLSVLNALIFKYTVVHNLTHKNTNYWFIYTYWRKKKIKVKIFVKDGDLYTCIATGKGKGAPSLAGRMAMAEACEQRKNEIIEKDKQIIYYMEALTDAERTILATALFEHTRKSGPLSFIDVVDIVEKIGITSEYEEYSDECFAKFKDEELFNLSGFTEEEKKYVRERFSKLRESINKVQSDGEPVGKLNTRFGLKGYCTAEVGTEVFEVKDRYVIYLVSDRDMSKTAIPFYKNTLAPNIDFYKA